MRAFRSNSCRVDANFCAHVCRDRLRAGAQSHFGSRPKLEAPAQPAAGPQCSVSGASRLFRAPGVRALWDDLDGGRSGKCCVPRRRAQPARYTVLGMWPHSCSLWRQGELTSRWGKGHGGLEWGVCQGACFSPANSKLFGTQISDPGAQCPKSWIGLCDVLLNCPCRISSELPPRLCLRLLLILDYCLYLLCEVLNASAFLGSTKVSAFDHPYLSPELRVPLSLSARPASVSLDNVCGPSKGLWESRSPETSALCEMG